MGLKGTGLAPEMTKKNEEAVSISGTEQQQRVYFVDSGVDNYEAIIAALPSDAEVYILRADDSALEQIATQLGGRSEIDAISIISHGSEGQLELAGESISQQTLLENADTLARIGDALSETGDILLYGCNVGAGEAGIDFLNTLAESTGADVAGSDDLTGHRMFGGDWDLEVSSGTVANDLAMNQETMAAYRAVLPTITFDSVTQNGNFAVNVSEQGINIAITTENAGNFFQQQDGGGVGGSSGNLVGDTFGTGLTKVIFNFDTTVDITSLQFIEIHDDTSGTFTFTNTTSGSSETKVINASDSTEISGFHGRLVTLNFTNVDSMEVTYSGGAFGPAFDALTFTPSVTNASPAISLDNSNLTYTENASATQIDSAATVSDADGDADWNGGTLVAQITANNEAGDQISISDTDGDGTAITVSGTNILSNGTDIGDLSVSGGTVTNGTALTITFDADATNANVQEVLQSLRYSSTSDDPGTSNRTITVTATDTNAGSNSDTRTVAITSVNDEPTLTATGSSPTFTEGGAAASLFSGSSVSTVESGQTISGLTFTVTNVNDGSNERLNVDGTAVVLTHGTSGTSATNSLGYSVSVVGTTATVTLSGGTLSTAAAQTLVDGMSYQNNSNSPNTSNRVVTLTSVQDSGGTTNSGDDTASLSITSTVTVTEVNDEPTLTATGSNPTFTEGGAASSLFSGSNISTVESGQTLSALTFTVTNVNDGSNEVLNVDGTAIVLTNGTSGTSDSNSLSYSVSVSGTTATVTLSGGTLSTAAAQTLVDGISYQNNSGDPNTSNRVVTLTSLTDSGSNTGSNDNIAALSVASTVSVTGVNDEPTLTASGNDPTFTEGGSAASLFSSTSVGTVESGQTISGLTFTVTNVNDGSNERLNVDGTTVVLTHGTSGTSATNSLSYSVSVSGTTATVTLSGGTLSTVAAQTLVNGMSYQNNSEDPNTSNRIVTLTSVQDSGGTANSGDDTASLSVASMVTVTDVNDEPTLTATGSSPTFSEGGSAVGLFTASAISTVEAGQNIASLVLTLTNVAGDGSAERLEIDGSNVALSNSNSGTTASNSYGYSVALSAGTATVMLTKTTTAANWQTLVDGITYENTGSSIDTNDRVATITTLNDDGGTANSGDDSNATLAVASTVTSVPKPTITSATYDSATNVVTVTGTAFVANAGVTNDVDLSALTFTGEGGATYTLTTATDVEITSATEFSFTLSGADLYNVEALLNQDGTSASGGTVYNLAAADDFITALATADTSDTTSNGITVSNYAVPTITSATYDVSTGQLVLTGTNFVNNAGAANDIDASLLTITGDNGATYTLTDTVDVEITSDTSATITLSSTDQLNAHGLLNKNGTTADSGTTYNLAAAEDWMTGAPAANNIVDATGNGITVSNVAAPTVTSATYDSDTGVLIVTGTNFVKESGAANDVDVSTLTLTGGTGNATYTLTSATDVEITSATAFSVTLSGVDKTGVDALLDQLGTSSSGGSTYNLAVADNWLAGAAAAPDISDTTGNGVTVSISPKITSATYDASTGTLVVTGTNIQANGGGSDIDASLFTLTGEGAATYTLTDTADVERDSATQFTLVLSATDKAAINQILNSDGTSSTGGTTFNLAAADDWDTNVTAGDTADTTGNGVTVNNVAAPTITSSTYDAAAGSLVVTGTGLLKRDGATNDIDVSTLTFTGEGGETHTLTDSSDVEITSGTEFTVSLSATDKAAINLIVNKNGTSSTSATTYNLAAAEDWATGAAAAVNVVDLTGNGITVSNVAAPTITSATYTTAGTLVVTGTGLLKKDGATNDIDVSLLTFTGEAGATYTLTDSADVELTSGSEFTVTLSSTDKTAVNALLNKAGTSSTDSTTYNLAAAEDWAAGADAAVNVVDTTGNGITVTIPPAPTPTPSTPAPTTETVDGVDVRTTTQTNSDGSTTKTQTIAPVTDARIEDTDTSNSGLADIPVLQSSGQSQADLSVALPVGIGLEATGSSTPTATSGAKDTLLSLIDQTVPQSQETDRQDMRAGGSSFLEKVTDDNLWVNKLTLTAASGSTTDAAVQISGQTTGSNGSAGSDGQQVALVIDASALPSGTVLQLNDVSFAVIVGPATLTGGEGANIIYAGTGSQHIVLGADDDELHGGDGDDTVGSKGGDDLIFGENGNDTLFGGAGADTLHGGADSDTVTYDGAMADYNVTQVNGVVTVALKTDASDSDTVINVETLQFSDQSFNPATSTQQEAIATLYQKVLGRQADVTGFQWWAKDIDNGYGLGDVALAFMRSSEYQTKAGGAAFDNLSVDQQVEALYTAVLGRASDSEGKAYWVAEADAGFSIDQMAEAFVTSTELTGQYLQSTQWDFIL